MNPILVLRQEDDLHRAFGEDGGGGAERLAPYRIVILGARRGHGLHAGLDDRAGTVGTREVSRYQRAAVGGETASRSLEDRGAFGMLEPDEAIVADDAPGGS